MSTRHTVLTQVPTGFENAWIVGHYDDYGRKITDSRAASQASASEAVARHMLRNSRSVRQPTLEEIEDYEETKTEPIKIRVEAEGRNLDTDI